MRSANQDPNRLQQPNVLAFFDWSEVLFGMISGRVRRNETTVCRWLCAARRSWLSAVRSNPGLADCSAPNRIVDPRSLRQDRSWDRKISG